MKEKFAQAHMEVAYRYAKLSYCNKRQVGCVIVKNNSPISVGYNGTPSGEENCCENEDGKTFDNVIHAEDNALRKLTRINASAENAAVFVTTAPCMECAVRLVDAGVSSVYYDDLYRCKDSIAYLKEHGIEVIHLQIKK